MISVCRDASRKRDLTPSSLASLKKITNSSPPHRQTQSVVRIESINIPPNRASRSSADWYPISRFRPLKSSISKNAMMPETVCWPLKYESQPLRFRSPVNGSRKDSAINFCRRLASSIPRLTRCTKQWISRTHDWSLGINAIWRVSDNLMTIAWLPASFVKKFASHKCMIWFSSVVARPKPRKLIKESTTSRGVFASKKMLSIQRIHANCCILVLQSTLSP